MFEYIKGTVVEASVDKIVLEVNGIGYRIQSSLNSISQAKKGEYATAYTYLVVREDEMSLYGFVTKEELIMFQKLISVSKVGPKVAVAILSTYTYKQLGAFILANDTAAIAKAPGVGKKTAERIVLELKDKVNKSDVEYENTFFTPSGSDIDHSEAVEALVALGYSRHEGEKAVAAVRDTGLSTEEMIKKALNWLLR